MESGKTFVFDGGGTATTNALLSNLVAKSGIDPSVLAAMNNGNSGFGGGNNGMFMMLFLLLLLGRNGLNGLGGGDAATIANNEQLLMNAINGNNTAIRDLATATNTSIQQVQSALAGLNTQLAGIGGQIGMSTQQVINSIQMGNSTLASQLAACCCEVKTSILNQGYESRLAELNQTNQLTATMTVNNRSVLDRIDALDSRLLNDKIDALRETNSTLRNEISNRNQNDFIYAQTAAINNRLSSIECHQLPTYPQQYIPGNPVGSVNVPYGPFGYPYGGYPFGGVPFGGGCGCHHHYGCGNSTSAPAPTA